MLLITYVGHMTKLIISQHVTEYNILISGVLTLDFPVWRSCSALKYKLFDLSVENKTKTCFRPSSFRWLQFLQFLRYKNWNWLWSVSETNSQCLSFHFNRLSFWVTQCISGAWGVENTWYCIFFLLFRGSVSRQNFGKTHFLY